LSGHLDRCCKSGDETLLFGLDSFVIVEFGIKVKGMDDVMRSLDKLSKGIDPQELARWASTCETAAKKICNDKLNYITLRARDKDLDFSIKDKKSARCLVKSIESNLPSMPLFIQGVFTKLASDLRIAKFNS